MKIIQSVSGGPILLTPVHVLRAVELHCYFLIPLIKGWPKISCTKVRWLSRQNGKA